MLIGCEHAAERSLTVSAHSYGRRSLAHHSPHHRQPALPALVALTLDTLPAPTCRRVRERRQEGEDRLPCLPRRRGRLKSSRCLELRAIASKKGDGKKQSGSELLRIRRQ